MNKGIGALIVGILAVLAGAFVATMLLKKKLSSKDDENDFDSFEAPVDDEEFEHFFGEEDEDTDIDSSEIEPLDDIDENEDEQEEQL